MKLSAALFKFAEPYFNSRTLNSGGLLIAT